MAAERSGHRYLRLYTSLLRLYPQPFRDRFGPEMTQVFEDLCHERREAGQGLFLFALMTFAETGTAIATERKRVMTTRQRNIARIAAATCALLLIPLVAMQFSSGVQWGLFDFIVAGGLLFGTGLVFELVARRASTTTLYRVAFGFAIGTTLLLIWVNLAVGLIGSEDNPANVLYLAVIATVFLGSILARLRARAMARALFVTAAVQALVPVTALLIWKPAMGTAQEIAGIGQVAGVNAFFVVLFVAAGLLFRWAADQEADRVVS